MEITYYIELLYKYFFFCTENNTTCMFIAISPIAVCMRKPLPKNILLIVRCKRNTISAVYDIVTVFVRGASRVLCMYDMFQGAGSVYTISSTILLV